MTQRDIKSILKLPSYEAAPNILGLKLSHQSSLGQVAGLIVEVEAYEQEDPASHSFGGKTNRNRAMFGPSGHAYIYLSYGMHWCLNIVTDREDFGSGVLIRGVYLTEGVNLAAQFRFKVDGIESLKPFQLKSLSDGPGKVTQALGVTSELYGVSLFGSDSPLRLHEGIDVPSEYIISTPRIGISKAVDRPWRWLVDGQYLKDYLSSST